MARNPISHVLFSLVFPLLISSRLQPCSGKKLGNINMKKEYFKGMFVFGTSVVDNGNNNNINASLSKANYLPYGVDFPFGPTGRFSNGKNVADIIGDLLHLPLIPPFADPRTKGVRILHGVNYGSGGSGILDDTGSITGGVISLNQQINNFEKVTLPELKGLLGHKTKKKLGRYLFVIAEGNNDFELNYFLQDASSRPTLPIFVRNLTSTFHSQLKRLYHAGARKFAILTVYPIGCTPVVKQQTGTERCVEMVNKAAQYYNLQVIKLVDELKQKLPASEFVVVNTYKIIRDIIKNPGVGGFTNATSPCCELKKLLGVGLSCKARGKVCKNRSRYIFFDGQHTTEAVNGVIATKAFSSNRKTEAYPFNLQILALL